MKYGLVDKVLTSRTKSSGVAQRVNEDLEACRKRSGGEKLLYCSFCGKSQHEVRKLIAGPSVFICDECIELCNDIIREETARRQERQGGQVRPADAARDLRTSSTST